MDRQQETLLFGLNPSAAEAGPYAGVAAFKQDRVIPKNDQKGVYNVWLDESIVFQCLCLEHFCLGLWSWW